MALSNTSSSGRSVTSTCVAFDGTEPAAALDETGPAKAVETESGLFRWLVGRLPSTSVEFDDAEPEAALIEVWAATALEAVPTLFQFLLQIILKQSFAKHEKALAKT